MCYEKKNEAILVEGASGLGAAILEQDLTGEGKGREGRRGGPLRSTHRGTESWGTTDEAGKEWPGRQEENQESVLSWKPWEDSISRRQE